MNSIWKLALFGVIQLHVAWASAAGNLVQNSSFEDGAAHWAFTGSAFVDVVDPGSARTGVREGAINDFAPAEGSISQAIPTTPGNAYYVEFWVAQNGSANATASGSFDGKVIFQIYVDNSSVPVAPRYNKYSGTVVASGTSAQLVFSANTVNQTVFVDDLLVGAVPELQTYSMFLLGMGVLTLVFRKNGKLVL